MEQCRHPMSAPSCWIQVSSPTCVGLSLRFRCLTGWMGRRNGCPRMEEGAEVERASEGAEIKFLGEPDYWVWVNGVLPSSGRSWRYPCITHSPTLPGGHLLFFLGKMEKDFVLIKLHAMLGMWLIFRVLTSTHTALGLMTSPAQIGCDGAHLHFQHSERWRQGDEEFKGTLSLLVRVV